MEDDIPFLEEDMAFKENNHFYGREMLIYG
jgi:hypothetical protein